MDVDLSTINISLIVVSAESTINTIGSSDDILVFIFFKTINSLTSDCSLAYRDTNKSLKLILVNSDKRLTVEISIRAMSMLFSFFTALNLE